MRARDPEEYRQSWQAHINNLAALALAANISYDEYVAAKQRLEQWLDTALENFERQRVDHE